MDEISTGKRRPKVSRGVLSKGRLAAAGALSAALATAGLAADLPVKEVTLFKHGVAHFVRSGEVASGTPAQLSFALDEMDDVLKTLTVVDRGGGVRGIRYDADLLVERRLARFPFELKDGAALAHLLDQLKGAKLTVEAGGKTFRGRIVGARVVAATNAAPEDEQVTLLVEGGEFRNVSLRAASSIRFEDAELQAQLTDYLSTKNQALSRNRANLYIDSTATGARQLFVAYALAAPLWKSSYRMLLSEAGPAKLEGWALVDNATGEDWKDVSLAVVSGKPVSFVSRLYQPRFPEREVAELAEEKAAAPVVHERAMRREKTDEVRAGVVGGVVGGRPGMAMMAAAPPPGPEMMASSVVELDTEGGAVGELFEYRFERPVTVGAGQSVMLPFVQQTVSAKKLLIFKGSQGNPRNAVEVLNNTGKTLDGGPVTIFDGGAYGGEALMETLKAGEKRLLSYAVDLGTQISSNQESRSDTIRQVSFRRGVLTAKTARVDVRTYTVRNVEGKAKRLVIEHPVRPGFQLLNPKPVETTSSYYRFEVNLPPESTQKLAVEEENVYDQTFMAANLTPDQILVYAQNRSLGEAGRRQLEQIAQKKTQIAEITADLARLNEQSTGLSQDQQRLRENIDSLNRVPGQQEQVQRYAQQLAAQEAKIAALRDEIAQKNQQQRALQRELNTLLEKLEF